MTDKMKLTILGCGSSGGVPRLGGPDGAGMWGDCDPANPKNRRRRCSGLFEKVSDAGSTHLLVDTAPDMREQLLSAHVTKLDGVVISHAHADQLHGIDDLRLVYHLMKKPVEVYAGPVTTQTLNSRFDYVFHQAEGSYYPAIAHLNQIPDTLDPFTVSGAGGDMPVKTFRMHHGAIDSLGVRVGPIAYSSDVVELDEEAFRVLEGVEIWVVDALRYKPHISHATVETALKWMKRVKPRLGVFTNLHVDLDYEKLKVELPEGIVPAYDGMVLEADL